MKLHSTPATVAVAIICCLFSAKESPAQQTISLESALEKAIAYYPSYQAALKGIESSKAQKRTAWDIGPTEISTGGDEIGNGNDATYKIIGIRQNFDIAGIGARNSYQNSTVNISTISAQIAETELKKNVSIDYAKCFIAQKRLKTMQTLDSLFKDFEGIAKLRYEVQAISYLEFLNTSNQSKQINLTKKQIENDFDQSVQNLNRWLGEDNSYVTVNELQIDSHSLKKLESFKSVELEQEQVKRAELQLKVDKSQYYPQLFVEYGNQKIGDKTGYHSYQVGVSGYLFMGAFSGKNKSSKIEHEIANINLQQQEIVAASEYSSLQNEHKKWEESFSYYNETVLPMIEEQKKSAITAYKEGAINYMDFVQNMQVVVQTELDYWNTFEEYLIATYNLIYFY